MEKICDTPLMEFDIYNVFVIQELRQLIRTMEAKASEKILEMYKEIIVYLIIVYEGFEAYIFQVKKKCLSKNSMSITANSSNIISFYL